MERRRPIIILIVTLCISLSWVVFSSLTGKRTNQIKLPEIGLCAHRGAMDTHPENTIVALEAAVEAGAHMIEFDVALTRDDSLVLMHDATVNRTTNGQGKVTEMTYEELRNLDAGSWKSEIFKGEKVPTLDEALAILPVNIWINIHLKGDDRLAQLVALKIKEHDRMHQCFLATGTRQAQKAREVVPEILICNMDRKPENVDYVNETIALEADFIQLRRSIYPEYENYIKQLKENNIKVNYFGTDDFNELKLLFDYGVDFPLVNDIIHTMPEAESLGIKPWVPLFR